MIAYRIPEYQKKKKRNQIQQNTRDRKMNANLFPGCIGKFFECREYTEDMKLEDRKECQSCPYKEK